MWRPGPAEMESFCNPWMSPAVVYRDNKGHGQDPSSLAMCRFLESLNGGGAPGVLFSLPSLSVSSLTPDQMVCAKYSPTKELQNTAVTFKTT